ncbi:Collagen alpha-2(I) chain [Larimichthys crocea]|uniref:Uncharacterized protein n=1 Tax=Larimichthys crocea TaxID=215358 RepID=A0ACD3RKZ7_LARCR|nr:Collagen alpha-2(I) chain [Larimichthys crocea]
MLIPKGDIGFIGAPGLPGRPGKMGKPGPPGIRGNTGAAGFKGKAGPKGKQEPPGPVGPKGIPGLRGKKGESGRTGPKGFPGNTGTLGPIGPPGLKGMKGVQGGSGPKGVKGKRGPPGKPGAPGKRRPTHRWGSNPQLKPGQRKEIRPKTRPSTRSRLNNVPRLRQTTSLLKRRGGQKKVGYFYMDPNQGCPYDALKVFCNFTAGGTTCIDPLQSQIKLSWEPEKEKSKMSIQWFSQQHDENKFEYAGVDVVQLRFLRLHSHTSFQHMTVSCTANQSTTAGTANSANRIIHFLGDSGKEIISHLTTVSKKGCEGNVVQCVFEHYQNKFVTLNMWNKML